MASDLNEATIIGNMGDAPQVKEFSDGKKVANFTVATNKNWKNKETGEWVEQTEWHRVTVYDQNIIGWLERDAIKGTRVLIRGELRTREWEKDGIKRYTTEIVLNPYTGMLKFQGRTKRDNVNEAASEVTAEEGMANDVIPF